jgi:dipeptidyl aminopeptidase/acylaminoacyl peptidase
MRRLFLSLLFLTFALPAVAQAKHPFTFEDMMKLKRVGEPEVSPDGKWVIFSVVDVDLEANTKTPHIWIVPLSGSDEKSNQEKSGDQKSGVPHVSPNLRDVGTTDVESREHILIPDQDGDRPRWAPDGKRFAFLSTKEGGSQIWTADFDSATGTMTGVYKLTSIATEASGELWSPDGHTVLFTSDVYPECDNRDAIVETSCNARKLKEVQESKVKAQIFTQLLYRHWNAYKEGKRTHIFVLTVVEPNRAMDTPQVGLVALAAPRDLTPGDYDAPVFSLGGQDNYAFSPDGQEICYASNHDKNEAATTNNDLWIVPVNSTSRVGAGDSPAQVLAQARNVTADNPASDSTPLYSPDGRYIAYRAQQRPGYESDRFRLMLYDRKTGEKKNLTESFDRWVGTFVWTPDSKEIYFASDNKGLGSVEKIAPDGSELTRIQPCQCWDPAGFYDDFQLSRDGRTLVATQNTLRSPTEIVAVGVKGDDPKATIVCVCSGPAILTPLSKEEKEFDGKYGIKGSVTSVTGHQLTHFNDALLSQIAMSPLESYWFTGAHGDKVEGFLVKPPIFDASKKYPVKFLIHGGPQGAWGDDWSYRWNPELFAAPTSGSSNSATSSGYVVIMINFHGSTGYGQKFIDAINGDWGGAPFEDLMKGLDYAEQTYPFIDKTRECALGASYGGYMINWILGHTDRFKCLVSHDGMFNAESAWGSTEEMWFNNWEFKGTPYDNRAGYVKWSPHQYAKNFKTPTLVIHGQRDYRLDVSEGFQLFTTLQMEGVPSKMLYFPDEGHWVQKPQNAQLWYKTVNDWVDQWLKK